MFCLMPVSVEKGLRSTAIPEVRDLCYEIPSSHTSDRGNSVELFIQSWSSLTWISSCTRQYSIRFYNRPHYENLNIVDIAEW